jgi:hypothetical protein
VSTPVIRLSPVSINAVVVVGLQAMGMCEAGRIFRSFAEKVTVQSQQIAALASVHRLLRSRIPPPEDTAQMPLF